MRILGSRQRLRDGKHKARRQHGREPRAAVHATVPDSVGNLENRSNRRKNKAVTSRPNAYEPITSKLIPAESCHVPLRPAKSIDRSCVQGTMYLQWRKVDHRGTQRLVECRIDRRNRHSQTTKIERGNGRDQVGIEGYAVDINADKFQACLIVHSPNGRPSFRPAQLVAGSRQESQNFCFDRQCTVVVDRQNTNVHGPCRNCVSQFKGRKCFRATIGGIDLFNKSLDRCRTVSGGIASSGAISKTPTILMATAMIAASRRPNARRARSRSQEAPFLALGHMMLRSSSLV